jgi:acetoacetyl-CoA reductase/3-oxoacyl-[acyl-carrier protein] reductase
MLGLDDKVILVTGGSRGIGAATVKLLKKLGAKVAYVDRLVLGLPGALALQADVTDARAMAEAVQRIERELGPIYGVVANAGINEDNLLPKLTADQWQAVIDINLTGVFNTIKPVIPLMYERRAGAMVFIGSVVGEQGNIGQANYAASKAGLIGLAKAIALEGARYGVRANVVAPGFTETVMLEAIPDNIRAKILETIPLQRFGKPEEIAWGVAYLLSPVAGSYVSGTTLSINGGRRT